MSAKGGGRNLAAAPSLIVLMSFPVGYSVASCSPAELASASPTGLIVIDGPRQCLNFLSHERGAPQMASFDFIFEFAPHTGQSSQLLADANGRNAQFLARSAGSALIWPLTLRLEHCV